MMLSRYVSEGAKKQNLTPRLKVLLDPAILANTGDNLISHLHVAVLAATPWNKPCEPKEVLETILCFALKGWLARKSVASIS